MVQIPQPCMTDTEYVFAIFCFYNNERTTPLTLLKELLQISQD